MIRKLPTTPHEYLQVLRRRRWWAIVPMVLIPLVVFLVSLTLPRQYRSETLILVQPQKVPTEYVHTTVTGDVIDRMQTLSEEIMSRTRLQQIIDDLHLYPKMQGHATREAIIDQMRKDITVDVVTTARAEKTSIGAFKISYVGPTPEVAQKVTEEISNLFIRQNLQMREQQAQGTSQFIDTELEKARQNLEQQEAKIKVFNSQHMGALPEQMQSNLQLLSQYQALAQSNSEAIDRAHQQQVYLQSLLSASGSPVGGTGHVASAQELDVAQRRAALAAARLKYTDSHPDVRRLQSELATAEQAAKTAPPTPAVTASGAPAGPNMVQQLQGQLASTQQEMQARAQRQRQLEAQLGGLQGRVSSTPTVQSQFADLSRDYIASQTIYQTLLQKQQDAKMAAALEKTNGGEQFRILDPASRPSTPSAPNLLIINGAGFLAAILFSLLIAVVAEMKDATIHNADDMVRYLDIPLITTVPRIRATSELPVKTLTAETT